MLGIKLKIMPEELELLSSSVSEYKNVCSKGKKPIVELVLKRMNENQPRFDGMYIRTMEEALDLSSNNDSSKKEIYQKIKKHLKEEREKFQFNAMKRLFETA